MYVYFAKQFTATASGHHPRAVTCEKCATEYHYLLTRAATGTASAPYYIGQAAAERRAEKRAHAALAKRLAKESELVPCPKCKWINANLVHAYRKTRYGSLLVLAIVILIIAAAIDLFLFLSNDFEVTTPMILIAVISILAFAATFGLQFFLRSRIDPNLNANGKPKVPVGTPPALLKSRNPATGEEILTPVPSDLSNLTDEAQWATFRPGQLEFPPLCCQCLDSATALCHLPMQSREELSAPICHPCQKKLTLQWWLRLLAAIPLTLLIAWIISLLIPGLDDIGRWMLIFIGAFVLFIAAIIINTRILRPYTVRYADRSRDIFKIHFQNPAYTAILIRNLGEQDGLYPQR